MNIIYSNSSLIVWRIYRAILYCIVVFAFRTRNPAWSMRRHRRSFCEGTLRTGPRNLDPNMLPVQVLYTCILFRKIQV
jgi:hypothetical protein